MPQKGKRALKGPPRASKVEGVSKVNVTFDTREAVVTFDDAKTSVQKLTKATADAGYPSSVKQ